MLGDLAILTGGTLISEDLGIELENIEIDQLGQAKKVTVDKNATTMVEGAGKHYTFGTDDPEGLSQALGG